MRRHSSMLMPCQDPSSAFIANGGATFVPTTSSRGSDADPCTWDWPTADVARVMIRASKSVRIFRIAFCLGDYGPDEAVLAARRLCGSRTPSAAETRWSARRQRRGTRGNRGKRDCAASSHPTPIHFRQKSPPRRVRAEVRFPAPNRKTKRRGWHVLEREHNRNIYPAHMPPLTLRLRFALLLLRLFGLLLLGDEWRNIKGLTPLFWRLLQVGAFGRPRGGDGLMAGAAHQVEEDALAHAAVGDAQLADRPGGADRIEDRATRQHQIGALAADAGAGGTPGEVEPGEMARHLVDLPEGQRAAVDHRADVARQRE